MEILISYLISPNIATHLMKHMHLNYTHFLSMSLYTQYSMPYNLDDIIIVFSSAIIKIVLRSKLHSVCTRN